MTHLIGPGLEHKFPPEWQKNAEDQVRKRIGENGRPEYPERIRFVTYTLKQNRCGWVAIQGLEKHYERASVDAGWIDGAMRATTSNVNRLTLSAPLGTRFPNAVMIDGQNVVCAVVATSCDFVKERQGWKAIPFDPKEVRKGKRPGVQGPIDDAFTGPFLCVVGTGTPNLPEMHRAALAQLERFQREWDKYMRGVLPVKKDTEVTDDDKKKNLILFGDPDSNRLIADALKTMPFEWTASSLNLDGKNYDPKSHLPMLIQSSPFSAHSYVVFNSGHTFHEADFKGTNALLYPRLGDFAVVKPTPTDKDPAAFEVIVAGLFDEQWQFPKK